ncbi:hypothetical protein [Streptacidiphilus sp. PAMC 29251]
MGIGERTFQAAAGLRSRGPRTAETRGPVAAGAHVGRTVKLFDTVRGGHALMNGLLNTLGDVLGTVMDVTGKVTLAVFCGLLVLMAVAVPLYTLYAIVSSMRASAGTEAGTKPQP